jgi:diguanylate cyclase (GGDEF)-like protein
MAVLMIDLDRFKQVNDRYGHEAGDRVLVAVAECMRGALRVEDVYGRIGGDEFVVVMAAADEVAGRAAAERLERRAAMVDFSGFGLPNGIPLSIGLASGVHSTPEDLMRAADVDLYRVKDARRAGAMGVSTATGR